MRAHVVSKNSVILFFNHMSSRTHLLVWQLLPRSLCVTTGDVLIPVISEITLILIKLIAEPETSYSAQCGKHSISFLINFLFLSFFFISLLLSCHFLPYLAHDNISASISAILIISNFIKVSSAGFHFQWDLLISITFTFLYSAVSMMNGFPKCTASKPVLNNFSIL